MAVARREAVSDKAPGGKPGTGNVTPFPAAGAIKTVGVIGAGQMGNGIAHVSALSGLAVRMLDVNDERLKTGLENIKKNMARQAERGKISADEMAQALKRIKTGIDYRQFAECDMVIEAATENEQIKREIFKTLIPHLKPEAIICTNTSSISITRLAASTDRPGRFMGMHFMNPVPVMELVELIRGIATEEATFQTVRDFTLGLGKKAAVAEDFPAFIVNRILLPMINEAVYTLYEGVGTVTAIDTAMRLGAHHPMGPLQLADFIGLDTCLAVMHVLHDGLADSKYRPCPLLVKYVEAGWLGRKSGRGFYDYSAAEPVPTR
jgi:3-hydroxybutyryl-CoA dehydrogenase